MRRVDFVSPIRMLRVSPVSSSGVTNRDENHDDQQRRGPYRCGDNVDDHASPALARPSLCQLDAEAAVDNAHEDEKSAEPDVRMRPLGFASGAFVLPVVHESRPRLEQERYDDGGSDNRVCIIESLIPSC